MKFSVTKPGMLTSVQDLGRWGYQASGVPVAGAMDLPALRIGNVMLGNDENAAALEVTLMGPELVVSGEGLAAFAGADLGFSVNGKEIGSWTSVLLKDGDTISFKGPRGCGCRGYLCFGGGVDVPAVMGSRSTYTRAKIGGYEGRALKAGDTLNVCDAAPLWKRADGFSVPCELRPNYDPARPLQIIMGLQSDAFTEAGVKTLFESEYTISTESDRMGCRMEGPKVEHKEAGADIVSDGIPLGTVQIPGHGLPIAMLADRQTTGGYTKIGVLTQMSIQALVQRMPGMKVHFEKTTAESAVGELLKLKENIEKIRQMRFSYISRSGACAAQPLSPNLKITFNGKVYEVQCEEI